MKTYVRSRGGGRIINHLMYFQVQNMPIRVCLQNICLIQDMKIKIKLFISEKLSFVDWYFYQFMPALRVKSSEIFSSSAMPNQLSHRASLVTPDVCSAPVNTS